LPPYTYNMDLIIRNFQASDWETVKTIYAQGLRSRNATFETEMPDYDSWIKKFHPHLLWVAVSHDEVVGWAGLQPVSTRKVYEGVAEVTIYIASDHSGKRVGSTLMKYLVEKSEEAGIWTLYASIFPENIASTRLHISCGFREIGYREKIARLDDVWRNTVLFERRSKINI
jgi:L-amino acid N-acyltransferase YncA